MNQLIIFLYSDHDFSKVIRFCKMPKGLAQLIQPIRSVNYRLDFAFFKEVIHKSQVLVRFKCHDAQVLALNHADQWRQN